MKGTVVIAGPGSAFGFELAQRFGTEGYGIVLIGRNVKSMKGIAARLDPLGIDAEFYPVNLSNPASVRDGFEQVWGAGHKVEAMIYNAVGRRDCTPSQITSQSFFEDIAVTVGGAVECSRVLVPYYIGQERGALMFTGGGVASDPARSAATMSLGKAALRNYVLNLAGELAGSPVYTGLLTITAKVDGTTLTARQVADRYWQMFVERNEAEVTIP